MWNMPTHLSIVYGCFHDTMAELSCGKRLYGLESLEYLLLAFYRKGLLTTDLEGDPESSGTGIPWELVRNTESQTPPPGIFILTRLPGDSDAS